MTAVIVQPAAMGFTETLSYGFSKFCEGVEYAAQKSWPALKWAAEKVHDLWLFCLPFLEGCYEFLKSPPGIVLSLVVLTFVCLKISQHVENNYVSSSFLVLGVIAGIFSGAIMNQIKFLPPSFVGIFLPQSSPVLL